MPSKNLIIQIANYYIDNKSTVRLCAKNFNLSKSTIHNYLTIHLPKIDQNLYKKVSAIAQLNFSQKHLRGGQSTKLKFKNS